MALVNEHFLKLPGSYLFSDIAKKVNTFKITHPKQDIIRLGIGDVTQPLPKACIEAMALHNNLLQQPVSWVAFVQSDSRNHRPSTKQAKKPSNQRLLRS